MDGNACSTRRLRPSPHIEGLDGTGERPLQCIRRWDSLSGPRSVDPSPTGRVTRLASFFGWRRSPDVILRAIFDVRQFAIRS